MEQSSSPLKTGHGILSVSTAVAAKSLWLAKDSSLMDPTASVLSVPKLSFSKQWTSLESSTSCSEALQQLDFDLLQGDRMNRSPATALLLNPSR